MEQHLHFFGEVLVGQEISTHVRLLDRTTKFVKGVSILVNHSTGRVANTVEFTEGHVDLTNRRASRIREVFAGTLDRVLAEHQGLPWAMPRDPRMVPVSP